MTGMTGNVPYYGGRLSPAQAYAASHPHRDVPFPTVAPAPRSASPAPPGAPAPPPPPAPPAAPRPDALEALDRLLESGVVTDEEYRRLRARVTP
jgi:hypothetical protein